MGASTIWNSLDLRMVVCSADANHTQIIGDWTGGLGGRPGYRQGIIIDAGEGFRP